MTIEIIAGGIAALVIMGFAFMRGKTENPNVIPTVAGLGDSTLWGSVGPLPGRLDVPPCERINQLAGGHFVINDYSFGGCTSKAALLGIAQFPPRIPFSEFVALTPEQFVLIKYGGADGFLEDHDLTGDGQLSAFKARMIQLCNLTKMAGKTPILVTSVRPGTPLTQFIPRYDDITRQVSQEQNIALIDVAKSVQFDGLQDLCVDEIHAGQAYSDRIAAHIVQELHLIARA